MILIRKSLLYNMIQ
uniref:Uncharacterized protein n=1 Tax=Cryptosporidium parvum TaxID=5807 RepID=F0X5E5_CRYPV